MRIGLDLDDTVNSWWSEYLERFGPPTSDAEITYNVENVLRHDKDFWLNLPVIHRPDFEVELFCTKRVHSKKWTKEWLSINNISPNAPVYQLLYQRGNKARLIKGKVDVFVDDSISNFIQMNLSGVPCLLMDSPNNKQWGPVGRVYSLKKKDIIRSYYKLIQTNFKVFYEASKEHKI